jgi:zinc transport system substrate-binding protein
MKLRLILTTIAVVVAGGCASGNGGRATGGVSVVANFFPIAEAARRVGGRLVHVTSLTPAGVEPHDLELTSREVDEIDGATVVFYVGSGFQPAVAVAAKHRRGLSVDVAAGLLGVGDAEAIARQDGATPTANARDPHFWLDPLLMAKAVDRVSAGLDRADPKHATTYDANAVAYKARLSDLDHEYATTLAHCARHEIVTAHAAFFYLARRYGLTQYAITGVSPDAEGDPQRIADLSDLIRRNGVTTVFYEELVPRDFADALAKDAGVKTDVLNPIEGLSKNEVKVGENYLSVMRGNLAALAKALDCR